MPKARARTGFAPKLISIAVASCFVTGAAFANPTGPAVVNGQVTFHQQGNLLQITNSPNAIINWQSFSIGASEITRFLQQSASSAVLNRVIAQNPSSILGALQSNGRVFLINPNGILFGAGAQVDVAGLVASTLNLSNADFLAGKLKFTEVPGAGSVINQGNIATPQGGQVYLVGPSVTNSGIITSPKGEVILAAGNSVELVNPGTPNLRVEITAPDNQAVNLGQIVADSGRVGIYAGLINQAGTIRVDSAQLTEGGRILLKATRNTTLEAGNVTSANGPSGGSVTIQSGDTTLVAGNIEAKGSEGAGGTVQVLGNLVGLIDNANVDVSGATGGGTVLVGGDYQGKNADAQNAFRTYVGPNATITADATTSGDGGKVIIWSDDATRFYGKISARGGVQSGNGGFAEVSGHNWLDYQGLADLRAPNGRVGTLLLDPAADLEIIGCTPPIPCSLPDNFAGGTFDVNGVFSGASGTAQITWTTIDNALDLGDVTGTTTGTGGSGNARILADSPDLATSSRLRLLVHNDITVDGIITNTGTGAIEAYAGWDEASGLSSPTVIPGVGIINVNRSVSTGGIITLAAGNDINVGSAVSLFPRVVTAGGMMTVTAGDTLTIQGGMGVGVAGCVSCARLTSAGGQAISAANINVFGGSGDNSFADIRQTGAGANQIITLTGSTLTLQGGSGGPDNFARIRNEGTSQQINFSGTGVMTLTGGTGTSGNFARVQAFTGSLTQTINGSPPITLNGGASGGVADDGNFAQIIANAGLQTIAAGNTTLIAGAGGVNNFVNISGPNQDITVNGNLVLTGGGSAPSANSGGGARIGGLGTTAPGGPTPTNLLLNVTGDVTLTGGSMANAGSAIGSNINGGQTTDITMDVGGNVTLNPGAVAGAGSRIGSSSSNIAGGNILVNANGDIALNSTGPGLGSFIRTTDLVQLYAGGNITQGADSQVIADRLVAGAGGGVSMIGSNMVNLIAGNATGSFQFRNGQSLEIGSVPTAEVAGINAGSVDVSVTNGDLNVNQPVYAGGGGDTINLTASAGSINVTNTEIEAANCCGPASVTLTAATGITVSNSMIGASGSSFSNPNAALVSMTTTGAGAPIQIQNNSKIFATAFEGGATVQMTAPGPITVGVSNITGSGSSAASVSLLTTGPGANIMLAGPAPSPFTDVLNATCAFECNASVSVTAAGSITVGGDITTDGSGGGVALNAGNAIVGSGGALRAAAFQEISLEAVNGIGTLANPIRIFDDQPNVIATNTASGAVVLSQVNNDVVIDDGAMGIANNTPGGLIAGFAESGNMIVSSIDKTGNALLLSGASGLVVNDGANITADTLTLQTTSPGGSISLGNAQLSAVKAGLPVSSLALVIQAVAGGDVQSSANMSTASGELIITGRHVDLDVMGLGRTLVSGGDVTITAAGRLSANNFLPATAFVNIQGTDIMLTSGTDPTLADQRFIALGHGAGHGNLTATSGPININAGTSFGGCLGSCYQGNVVANASDIMINTGTFFATSGDIRAPSGNITINTGPTGLFIGDFTNLRSAQVNAGMNLTVNTGQVVLQGGSGANTFAELRGGPGTVNITTSTAGGGTGDVFLSGGSGTEAFARIFGDPDLDMTVGGAIAVNAGSGTGAFAKVESASPSTIRIRFPNLDSGGYSVTPPGGEPVEGAIAIGTSGFFAGGQPAVLGQNLLIAYGTAPFPSASPPLTGVEVPQDVINQIVVANELNTDVILPDQTRGAEAGEGAPDDKKKEKELPVCK